MRMEHVEELLKINDKKHMIQGVEIPEDMYLNFKAAIRYSVMEGWKPKKEDIEYLLVRARTEDPIFEKKMKDLWKV